MIDYGRPSVRGRAVFSHGVLGDTVWRTGANAATQIVATRDLVIGRDTLRAGTYSVWTRVAPNNVGYALVFNSQTGQWGTEHHSERDVLSVPLSVERLPKRSRSSRFESCRSARAARFAWSGRRRR